MSSPEGARGRISQRLAAEGLVVAAIVAWWLTSAQFPVNVFPSPMQVFRELVRLSADAEFWGHAAATGVRVLLAVILATVLGSALGMLPRYAPWTGGIVDDVLIPFFTSFPAIVWAILGTIWFGLSDVAILIVQTLIIFPFCLVNVTEGGKDIGREEIEMGRSFGRRPLSIFWRIELPLLAPFIISGARISYGVCWKISLIAELFGGRSGLGYLMQWARDFGSVDVIIAICLAIVVFVTVGDAFVMRPLTRLFEPKPAPVRRGFLWRRMRTGGAPSPIEGK